LFPHKALVYLGNSLFATVHFGLILVFIGNMNHGLFHKVLDGIVVKVMDGYLREDEGRDQ
jgi:hypothetical protein